MNHPDLVKRAAKWLAAHGHSLVITEMVTTGETPDAIGWRGSLTTLIECKADRRDWRRDTCKPFRPKSDGITRSTTGMGARRYLMAEAGVIPENEVYEGWGLLVVDGRGVRRVLESKIFKDSLRNWRNEMLLLHSACRRLGAKGVPGVSVRGYSHSTKNVATCSVDLDMTDERLLEAEREQGAEEAGGGAEAAGTPAAEQPKDGCQAAGSAEEPVAAVSG